MQLPNDEAVNAFALITQNHPHIGPKIECFWGHKEFPDFIRILMLDTRDNTRAGFSWEVLNALTLLQKLHDELFPQYAPAWNTIWDKWCDRD